MGGTTSGATSAGFCFFRAQEQRKSFMVTVNGEEKDAAGKTVAEYVESAGFNVSRVVVEINEAIVPKGRYAETVLRDGDSVEVVCFMGGG